jgi:hypothetical protein
MLKLLFAAPLLLADFTVCVPIHNEPLKPIATHDYAAMPQYPRTMYFDGMPPERFRAPKVSTISTGTVDKCGSPPPGVKTYFEACVRGSMMHLPNPCDYPEEKFATLFCHEQGHQEGWPADHGA